MRKLASHAKMSSRAPSKPCLIATFLLRFHLVIGLFINRYEFGISIEHRINTFEIPSRDPSPATDSACGLPRHAVECDARNMLPALSRRGINAHL